MRSSWSLLLIKSVKIVRFKYCRPSPILLFCSLLFYFIILVRFNSCSCYNNNRSDFRYQLKSAVCNRLFIGCISTHSAHFHIKSTSAVFDFIYYNKGLGTWYSTIGFICGLKWQTKLEKWKMPNVRWQQRWSHSQWRPNKYIVSFLWILQCNSKQKKQNIPRIVAKWSRHFYRFPFIWHPRASPEKQLRWIIFGAIILIRNSNFTFNIVWINKKK